MKRIIAGLLLCILMTTSTFALPEMSSVKSRSAILFDESGQVLYEYNADEKLPPASVTKIMTMLLAMEAVDSGKVSLDDMVTGSAHACSMGGTQIWLKEGEQLSLNDMMKAIAVGSANDCAVAVAEHLAGSEEAFVSLMNKRAQELGMENTTFVNANGLDRDGTETITTARDIGLMSVELLKHPKIFDYTTIWMDTIRNGEFTLANTNKLLKKYDGLNGLKTGFTRKAMYCISATAKKDDLQLIAAVMSAPSIDDRTNDITALLNYGFANFTTISPVPDNDIVPVKVVSGKEDCVEVELLDKANILVEKEQAGVIEKKVSIEEELKAPIIKGQTLGEVSIISNGNTIKTIPLIAKTNVEKLSFKDIFVKLLLSFMMKDN